MVDEEVGAVGALVLLQPAGKRRRGVARNGLLLRVGPVGERWRGGGDGGRGRVDDGAAVAAVGRGDDAGREGAPKEWNA